MPRTKQTLIEKFNVLLIEANAAEIAEMKQALYWHGVFMGAEPKAHKPKGITANRLAIEPTAVVTTDPAAKG